MQWLRGPQVTDLPIRTLALIYASTGLLPGASDASTPLYLWLFVLAHVLYLGSAFLPLSAGLAGLGFSVVFTLAQPEHMNPFSGMLVFSSAVLLVKLRVASSLTIAAGALGAAWIEHELAPIVAIPYELLLVDIIEKSLVALAAAGGLALLRKEIKRRADDSNFFEGQKRDLRVRLALDTHDTVSHGLTQQTILFRMMGHENSERRRKELLLDASIVNYEIQAQLRAVLTRMLSASETEAIPAENPAFELIKHIEKLIRAAEASGTQISLHVGLESGDVTQVLLPDAKFIARELVTNVIKHSATVGPRSFHVRVDRSLTVLELYTSNIPRTPLHQGSPQSLCARAASLGGSCVVSQRAGSYEVQVLLPVNQSDTISPEDVLF